MTTALIAVPTVVVYVVVASAIGIHVWQSKPCERCRNPEAPRDRWGTPRVYNRYGHVESCECGIAGFLVGMFWPVGLIFLAVWTLLVAKKLSKSTRLGRVQRKARKVQDRIDAMEKELGIR